MTLFRPVGLRELELNAELKWRAFPPRLEIQPIFYPVLNFEYAAQIARDWNTRDPVSGFAGWVTRFEVEDAYAQKFEPQVVGAAMHREMWVPAEEMDEFNAHITGPIQIEAVFTGDQFAGEIDGASKLPQDVLRRFGAPQ
jgi:hypothetical protein